MRNNSSVKPGGLFPSPRGGGARGEGLRVPAEFGSNTTTLSPGERESNGRLAQSRAATGVTVNGAWVQLNCDPDTSLLTALRNGCGLTAAKYGCGLGECGACTVLVDGVAARACVIPVVGVAGRNITTLEGLGHTGALHPVQQAFIDAQAAQCGYCLNGMMMMTVALLKNNPNPTDIDIANALAGNLCRCGTHVEIMQAVRLAARRMQPLA
jgi:nicotinate dehydrogenase subunit A